MSPGQRDEGLSPGQRGLTQVSRDWLWPVIVIVGLTIVVAVNAGFIYIAVSGADEVVESYQTGHR